MRSKFPLECRPLESFLLELLAGGFAFASYGVRPDAVGECQAMMAGDFQTRRQDADVR
jgi:hypothetical protein